MFSVSQPILWVPFLKLDLFSVPSCLGFNLFWAIFETSLKIKIAVLNVGIFFLLWPSLPPCQSLCYFQLDLFSLLSCLGFKLFCVTARRGNSEPLLFSDPEPEDYGNVISSLSHHQPFSTLFAKCQPPRSKKSCLYKCQQTNHSEPEDFGNVNSVGLLLLLVSSSTYFDSFPLEKHQSTTVKRYNVGLQTNKPSGAGGLWKCDLDRGLCDSSLNAFSVSPITNTVIFTTTFVNWGLLLQWVTLSW